MKTVWYFTIGIGEDGRYSETNGPFANEADCRKAAEKADGWGRDGSVYEDQLYETYEEWRDSSRTTAAARRLTVDNPEEYQLYQKLQEKYGR